MRYTPQRIRDPLHNLIEFRANQFENALWRVIETRPFQRLRRVKQLGFSDFVYPGATHSRFAHSVGVFHTARQLMTVISDHLGVGQFDDTRARAALAASLVHDLGHGPFSHAFEDVGRRLKLKMANHEHVSDVLIRDSEVSKELKALGSGFAADVADIIKSVGPTDLYGAVVSSQFDADRLDYMRRDRLMTGTQHAAIDFQWLIANLEVGSVEAGVDEKSVGAIDTFVLGPKAVYAAEAFVLGLFQLYPTVYFHKATRSAEKIFTELLFRVISLARDNQVGVTGLDGLHPLVRFAREPDKVAHVLSLDDTVIWGALPMMAEATDSIISEFATRLRDRILFKCVDVRAALFLKWGHEVDSSRVDKGCALISDKIAQWVAEKGGNRPRILVDEAIREPYKKFQESKGPLNQIRIRATDGTLVDLGERSKVVRAIEPFQLFRVCVSPDDDEAKAYVQELIQGDTIDAATK